MAYIIYWCVTSGGLHFIHLAGASFVIIYGGLGFGSFHPKVLVHGFASYFLLSSVETRLVQKL